MLRTHAFGTLCAVVMMFGASACASGGDDPVAGNGDRQGGETAEPPTMTEPDAGDPIEGEEGETPTQRTAFLRIAHLSPDAPAVDACIKRTGAPDSAFRGPILEPVLPGGLSFTQVTTYLPVPAGGWTARLVAPDATDCSTSLAGLPDFELPTLPGGAYATAAATGLVAGSPGFDVQAFVDRRDVPSGQIAIRFVHASPGTPPVDVGLGSGEDFTPIWTDVPFGRAGVNDATDPNGFLVTDPLESAVISARASGTTTDALVLPPVSFEAGSIISTFAIGLLGGTGDQALSVLACQDLAAASGGLTPCVRVP